MAYQITRNRIKEELEITDNNEVLKLVVDINVDSILREYNKANYAIAMAQKAANEAKNADDLSKAEESMGEAVLSLFVVIFGSDQTDQIIKFYDNKALEMLADIAPFIADVVQPRILEAQQRIQERYNQVNRRNKRR